MNHAIILLAGFGSRLKPLTDTIHKALIEVGGKTILERQLEALACRGVGNFHLVLGHRASDIREYVGGRFPELNVRFYANEIYARNNTGYSLNLVLRTLSEGFLLLDGDVILDGALLTALCASESSALLCETDPSKLDAEAVKVKVTPAKNATVSDVGKHVPLQDAHGESIGVGYFTRDWAEALHDCLERELRDENNWNWYYEDAMKLMLAQKTAPSPLSVIPTGAYPWVEIDDHADLNRARRLFK